MRMCKSISRTATWGDCARSTYQEQPEGIADPLHEQLILPEILLIQVEDLAIVEPAYEEEGEEEPYDHVYTRQSQ